MILRVLVILFLSSTVNAQWQPIANYQDTTFALVNFDDAPEFPGVPCGTVACIDVQFYPSTVIRLANGRTVLTAKSNRKLWQTSSPNGILSSNHGSDYANTVIGQGNGTPTSGGIEGNLFRYDDVNNIYHIYFGANDGAGAPNYNKQIFHGTTTDIESANWAIDYIDPVISVNDLPALAPDGKSTSNAWIDIGDMKVLDDGTHIYYAWVYHFDSVFGDGYMAYFTSPANDWTNISFGGWLFGSQYLEDNDLHPFGTTRNVCQMPSIIKYRGKYVMMFNHGNDGGVRDQRWIYCAVGDTPYDFEFIKKPVLTCGPDGGNTDFRVYNPQWLIAQKYADGYWNADRINGNLILYYSGVDVGETNNKGQTHRVEFESLPDFDKMDKIPQQTGL